MNYIEISIETPESELDARCDELCALGCSGVIIENENDFKDFLENNRQYWDYVDDELRRSYTGVSRLKCYITDDDEGAALLTLIRQRYAVTTRPVADSDWENNWRAYYKPIPVGERLLVVPEWESAEEDGRCVLRLDPGLMFGSGSHPTTKMCLAALQDYVPGARTVLDLGCGSGILGIGALVLGSDFCTACDIDPKAPDTVMENAALNGIGADKMKVYAGDIIGDAKLRKMLGTGYDIVLANIVSDVIIPLAPFVRAFMAQGGVFITSGIIDGREDEVAAALRSAGLEIIAHHHEEEWHCFECR